jgi:ABC-2 type transporter
MTTQTISRTIAPPLGPPRAAAATFEIARRALRKFFRTPGLFVMTVVQSAMFLLSFRFVFGGAIHTGGAAYVNYLVPGFVATVLLFTGGGIAVAVAEDRAQGFTDRLLSLPLPRRAIVFGRVSRTRRRTRGRSSQRPRSASSSDSVSAAAFSPVLRRWACASSTAWCSRSCSSSSASLHRMRRRRRACRWSDPSLRSCRARTFQSPRCPTGSRCLPSTSRSRRWSTRFDR